MDGKAEMLTNGEIVAANDHLHQPVLKLLNAARGAKN
jgi:myo-inositol-1(or 4)-monophosphatase